MIIDASAVLAIVLDEPEARSFASHIASSLDDRLIAPINFVEAGIVADSRSGAVKGPPLDEVMRWLSIRIAPATREHAILARDAYRRFGRGNHPARLNLGDCFAFALARARREPLLFKGGDFAHPDILAEIDSAL